MVPPHVTMVLVFVGDVLEKKVFCSPVTVDVVSGHQRYQPHRQLGATECGIIAVFSFLTLVAAGEAWRDVDVCASASKAERD
jgi:hypothetical protein